MRLTRGTIVIIIVVVAVVAGVLLVSVGPASAPPAPTAMPTVAAGGPLFPDLSTTAISRFAVEDLATGETVSYLRDGDGVWSLEDDASDSQIDNSAMNSNAEAFAALFATDTFPTEALGDYGLSAPAYLVSVQTTNGVTAELYVGGTNEAGNRHYAVTAMHTTETDSTAEATPSPDSYLLIGEQAVSTVASSLIDGWLRMFNTPVYVPTPNMDATADVTAEATAEATAGP